jgi:telomerase reverse transcriptase
LWPAQLWHCCRYAGEHIATSLTLPLRKRPGAALAVRLCQYLRPKIHPLLLDAVINSPQTVRLNIYQVQLPAPLGSLACLAPGLLAGCCMHPYTGLLVLLAALTASF